MLKLCFVLQLSVQKEGKKMHVTYRQMSLLLVFFFKVCYKLSPVAVQNKTKEKIETGIFKSSLFVKVPIKL